MNNNTLRNLNVELDNFELNNNFSINFDTIIKLKKNNIYDKLKILSEYCQDLIEKYAKGMSELDNQLMIDLKEKKREQNTNNNSKTIVLIRKLKDSMVELVTFIYKLDRAINLLLTIVNPKRPSIPPPPSIPTSNIVNNNNPTRVTSSPDGRSLAAEEVTISNNQFKKLFKPLAPRSGGANFSRLKKFSKNGVKFTKSFLGTTEKKFKELLTIRQIKYTENLKLHENSKKIILDIYNDFIIIKQFLLEHNIIKLRLTRVTASSSLSAYNNKNLKEEQVAHLNDFRSPERKFKKTENNYLENQYNANTYYNLGLLLQDKGDIDGAENAYRKTIKIDPTKADAYYNLGNLLWTERSAIGEAEKLYLKAIEIDPEHKNAISHLNTMRINGIKSTRYSTYPLNRKTVNDRQPVEEFKNQSNKPNTTNKSRSRSKSKSKSRSRSRSKSRSRSTSRSGNRNNQKITKKKIKIPKRKAKITSFSPPPPRARKMKATKAAAEEEAKAEKEVNSPSSSINIFENPEIQYPENGLKIALDKYGNLLNGPKEVGTQPPPSITLSDDGPYPPLPFPPARSVATTQSNPRSSRKKNVKKK